MEDQARKAEILVIEDEDNIAIALDYLLTREGYAQTRLATGAGAVDMICTRKPDLVLLDDTLQIHSVMANGEMLRENYQNLKKGTYE